MAIDKSRLIGSCLWLPGHFDVHRMRAEIASINDHPRDDRIHLIVDVEPDDGTLAAIRVGRAPADRDDEASLRCLLATAAPAQKAASAYADDES